MGAMDVVGAVGIMGGRSGENVIGQKHELVAELSIIIAVAYMALRAIFCYSCLHKLNL